MSRACGELPDKRGRFSAPSSSHLVLLQGFLACNAGRTCCTTGYGRDDHHRISRNSPGSRRRRCAGSFLRCTRAAYVRYAAPYLAAAVRLEVIGREEIRRGNLTSEHVDLRDRAEANHAGIVAALTPQSILTVGT